MVEKATEYSEFIKKIAKAMDEHDIGSVHITDSDDKGRHISFSLQKNGTYAGFGYAQPVTATNTFDLQVPLDTPEASATPTTGTEEVKSPMVGVFYSAPSPEADLFVRIGDTVKTGDVLCILEAMKLMNEITAEKDGKIADICVQNGDVVEFGQVLFKMDAS